MKKPILFVFNISHYCEKGRWALEYFGIDHEVRHLMLGTHRQTAKKLGASRGSVPFLQVGDRVIAGSAAIIDWCELQSGTKGKKAASLTGQDEPLVRSIEKRLDDVAGVHVRRYFYSEALRLSPQSVRPIFSQGLPIWQSAALTIGWPGVVKMMMRALDLGQSQGADSLAILDRELAWLDGLLADGRPYLTGKQWTRADLTAASLLAPLVEPKEHPMYRRVKFPQTITETQLAWAERPSLRLVAKMYAKHRRPSP